MDDNDLRILKEAGKPREYRPTTPEMRARAEALHDDRLLSRANENGGPWTYRITEKGRAALRGPVSPEAVDVVAPCGHLFSAQHVTAEGLRCRECEKPPALTPEVVLRAMLRAYEAAALDAEIAVQSVQKDSPAQTAASNRARLLTTQCGAIRREAAGVIAGWPDEVDFYTPGSQPVNSGVLAGDYEARLAGTRPLDAPPLEAP